MIKRLRTMLHWLDLYLLSPIWCAVLGLIMLGCLMIILPALVVGLLALALFRDTVDRLGLL